MEKYFSKVTLKNNDSFVLTIETRPGYTSKALMEWVAKQYPDHHKIELVSAGGKHLCPYCRDIANGTDDDLLCSDCRETFGHAFYHEL